MKKQPLLLAFALVLATLYVLFFTDWTRKKEIQISYTNLRVSPDGNNDPTVLFIFDNKVKYRLASVKVVSAADAATNKHPHALWHLVSTAGSEPVDSFPYGFNIPGMKPDVARPSPEPLDMGEKYCLIVDTVKKQKARISFDAP
jgi:hypothetical protein